MKFSETSKFYSLNKSTYVNLRWIAYIGQLSAILYVKFILKFNFSFVACILILFFSVLTNLYLRFKIRNNQLNNSITTVFLTYDILQLGLLFFLTGGITNPFIFIIIIPAVFSSQYLNMWSSITLVILIVLILIFFFFQDFIFVIPGK